MNATKIKSEPAFVYVVAFFAGLGGLLFGYDTGVISGAILFVKEEFNLTPFQEGFVVSAVLLGAILGAAIAGVLTDRYGRRKTVLCASGLFIIGSLIMAMAPSIPWILTGRIINGVAIGVASMTVPLYISELAPPSIRGLCVSFNQLAITIGILLSYVVDYAFAGAGAWRWMLGLSAVPGVIQFFGMLFLPESPRWLIRMGKVGPAEKALKLIRHPEEISQEITEIQESFRYEEGHASELFKKTLIPALIAGVGLSIFQQITGINTVIYYAPTIFQYAHFASVQTAILATAGVGVVNVLLTVVALLLLDRWGRRPLLFLGLIGMFVSLGALGLYFEYPHAFGPWLPIVSLMLYVGSFAISLGPIAWLLISEIYPLKIRGTAMSIATMANWVFNFIVSLTFLSLLNTLGAANTFWLYGALCLVTLVFVYYCVPETKGKSLEEIEASWRKKRF